MGVHLLLDGENFHPHAVFISQKIIDRIMRICKSFLKLGFFGHILFQNITYYTKPDSNNGSNNGGNN